MKFKKDANKYEGLSHKIIGLAAVSYNGEDNTDTLTWAFRDPKKPRWEMIKRVSDGSALFQQIREAFMTDYEWCVEHINRVRASV